MNKDLQKKLIEKGFLSFLDIHFARYLSSLTGVDSPELFLAAVLVSHAKEQGHVCLDLAHAGGRSLFEDDDGHSLLVCPDPAVWKTMLEKSPMVGKPGDYRPLILDDRLRLYLFRYWEYENQLAVAIRKRLNDPAPEVDHVLLQEGLNRLFPESENQETDWQKQAAMTALKKRFCVISGGPGTGKTTTIAAILALILEQHHPEPVRVALATPTGKAASRLQEALKKAKQDLPCPEFIKERIPTEASTLHRLLGPLPDSPHFRHHARNPLPVDVVMVDEASMVDMALLSKLVHSVPDPARLILLGDRDQLASVEAGAAFGDICDSGRSAGPMKPGVKQDAQDPAAKHGSALADCIIRLKKSYRFAGDGNIQKVSHSIKAGNGLSALAFMKNKKSADISWRFLPNPKNLRGVLKDRVINRFKEVSKTSDPQQALSSLERFQIICALRQGPYGVLALNRLMEEILKTAGLIDPEREWYPGRPVLIVRNDYHSRLFNGDIGVLFPDPESGNGLRVFFPDPDGRLRKLHPLRLPEHETVYAMTVHRSQGSEFDEVVMILPDHDSPVLTRELLYTGITRARKTIEVWGTEDTFCNGISRETVRVSGLRDALRGERVSKEDI